LYTGKRNRNFAPSKPIEFDNGAGKMKTYQYHMGLIMAGNKVIVQMRQSVDFLDCELWVYLGVRKTTKMSVREHKQELLTWINAKYNQNFTRIEVD